MGLSINFDKYIDSLIKKDDKAFEVVYENTKKGVFSMIISIVNNKAVTEDLMQDKMIEKIRSYKKGRNFNAWLLQIAKNTAIDYYRKYNRETVYDPQEKDYMFEGEVRPDESYMVNDMLKPLEGEDAVRALRREVNHNPIPTAYIIKNWIQES